MRSSSHPTLLKKRMIELLFGDRITLTRKLFQTLPVENCYVTSVVTNKALFLKFEGNLGDARSAHAKHVRSDINREMFKRR